jgi:hypothetical protein
LTDQPSAAEPARRPRTNRVDDAARRAVIARRRAAVAIGLVALLAIGGFLLLGEGVPLIPTGPEGPGDFSFELANVQASPITDTPPSQLKDAAREAGNGIKETMDELYFRAFVDSGSWGDYGAAFELFEGQAVARAEADAEVLTLGPTANDDYETLDPTSATLTIAVLTDRKDVPVTAVAEVQFLADAARNDGTSTQVSSSGSFFLRQADGVWRIFAYRVDRDDQAADQPSPAGSPS